MTTTRLEVGLFCAALVLVLNAVPLLVWELHLLHWFRGFPAHPSSDWLYNLFRTVAMTFGGGAMLALAACLFVMVRAALAVSTGRLPGVLTGLLASGLVAAVSVLMLLQGGGPAWLLCALINTANAAYLLFFRQRMLREAASAEP